MKTTVRRSLRARLLAFVNSAVQRLTSAWQILTRAQQRLLNALTAIRRGRGAAALLRTARTGFERALADFDRTLAAFIERWTASDLPLVYREGALTALEHADRPAALFTWTPRHQATVTPLAAQFYADLTSRLREALRRARAFLRDATTAARTPAGADPQTLTDRHPLHTVIYANQARHPVESWARAALTWQAVTTANAGSVTTAWQQLGSTHVKVRDGADCGWTGHQDPDRADGTLRTVAEALAHPTAHAHCVREFSPHTTTDSEESGP